MTVKAVLFDLDGTLIDSAPDLVGALNRLRGDLGFQPLPIEALSRFASRGAAGLLMEGMPDCGPEQFEAWKRCFLDYYAQAIYVESSYFDGVAEHLDFLDESGIPWGIVTNKSESLTRNVVKAAGMDRRAACVVCGDTLARSKPDPAPVLHACSILGVDPAYTVFAGDDVRDVRAGRGAGTQIAAVMYGYGSWELEQRVIGDGLRVNHPRDLTEFIRNSRAVG